MGNTLRSELSKGGGASIGYLTVKLQLFWKDLMRTIVNRSILHTLWSNKRLTLISFLILIGLSQHIFSLNPFGTFFDLEHYF